MQWKGGVLKHVNQRRAASTANNCRRHKLSDIVQVSSKWCTDGSKAARLTL